MDLFESRGAKPMLIGAEADPFDSEDYLFEVKFDGERCLAYLGENEIELRNKRDMRMLAKFPELSNLWKQVRGRCILDGELMVMKDGRPDFFEVQRRSLMSNRFKIELAAKLPATLTVFDILYLDGKELLRVPLLERKALLEKTVAETPRLAISRTVETKGTALYRLAEQNSLEGVVAKRKESLYYPEKRTKDWVKIKNMQDEDFVVCGYLRKDHGMASLVLGQYRGGELAYKGHVTLGVSGRDFERVQKQARADAPFSPLPPGNDGAVWLVPELVCVVRYLEKTKSGSLRHAVLKGLRIDKNPTDCIEN